MYVALVLMCFIILSVDEMAGTAGMLNVEFKNFQNRPRNPEQTITDNLDI